jgi:hypothetical protein
LRDSFIIDTLKNSRQFGHRGGGFPSLESEIFRRRLATRFIDYIRRVTAVVGLLPFRFAVVERLAGDASSKSSTMFHRGRPLAGISICRVMEGYSAGIVLIAIPHVPPYLADRPLSRDIVLAEEPERPMMLLVLSFRGLCLARFDGMCEAGPIENARMDLRGSSKRTRAASRTLL